MTGCIYTIGHSTHSPEHFLTLLAMHRVEVVCDVRSKPYSRMSPQFNQDVIRQTLKASGIPYVYLGKELGAYPEDKSCYLNGNVQFSLLAKTPLFKEGIERLVRGNGSYRVALMCAEKEPLECHRSLLIARALAEAGVPVTHILEDGQTEDHRRTLDRIIAKAKLSGNDLFRSSEDTIREAYAKLAGENLYDSEEAFYP